MLFEVLMTAVIWLIGGILGTIVFSGGANKLKIKYSLALSLASFIVISLMRFYGAVIFNQAEPQFVELLRTMATVGYFALLLPISYFAAALITVGSFGSGGSVSKKAI